MVNDYFLKLADKVCNSLNHIGYSYCKGNIMAKNPQWNKPAKQCEKYFSNWIQSPEPQNLLDATIFFDFRNVYGNEEFTSHLRETIGNMVPNHPVFLYHLANNMFTTKVPQITPANIHTDKNAEIIDLKGTINHIIQFTRIYALQNHIWSNNTIERLSELKSQQLISCELADELMFAYNFLMKLRFKNQVQLMEKNLPLSNILNTKELIDIELSILKKILSKMHDYHNKIKIDFKLNL